MTAHPAPATYQDHHRAGAQAWATLAVVAAGLFLAVLSTTLTSVALPSIGSALNARPTDLQWVVDAYVLVYAGLLVAGGVLGDRRGRKGTFVTGVALFGIGSLFSGLAWSIPVLLVARAVQGVGPALLVPASLAIIRATFDDERQRAIAIGLWSTSSGVALAVGPVLGGGIVQVLGWRWVFLLGGLFGVAVLAIGLGVLPRIPRSRSGSGFDWLGALLTAATIAGLATGLIEGQQYRWASIPVVCLFTGTVLAFTFMVVWERGRQNPLVDVSLFRRPQFVVANAAALVAFFGFVGELVYLSAYFQQVQGRSPIEAGLDVSAIGVSFALAAVVSGRIVGRWGARGPMAGGLLLAGSATLGLLRLGTATPMAAIWWNLALIGAGIGLCLTPMTSVAMASVDPARAGMASAIHNGLRQVGQLLGVAVLGALVYAKLPGRPDAGGPLPQAQGVAFVAGLHDSIWVAGVAFLVAALLAARLGPRRHHPRGA